MSVSVSEWRIFCLTENEWVVSWGITGPTTCPNNTSHSVNLDSVQLLQTLTPENVEITNVYQDLVQSQRVVQQTPVIDLKSFHGITTKNRIGITGDATITAISETDAEINLSITGVNDECYIRSAERGYYIAGLVSECGIAIRIPNPLDTTHELKFGYFDDNNGYYFKLVGNTLNVGIMHNGTETLITRDDFNKNKLDGSGPSNILLDFSYGNIFRISFTWYGFGSVSFGVIQTDSTNTQKFIPMHTYNTKYTTSCANPYLPINVKLSSNGSALSRSVFVAGRQYSILGKLIDNNYNNSFYINDSSVLTTSQKYLFSIKNKDNFKTCIAKLKRITILCSTNAILKILKNGTLSASNFIDNPQVDESCLSIDTSATITDGTVCKSFLLFENVPMDIDINNMTIYEDDIISFVWNSLVGTATLSIQVEWEERW